MTELRTPDELTAENELICEKLLGWKRRISTILDVRDFWIYPNGAPVPGDDTPSFITWADAGMILDRLQEGSNGSKLHEACGGLADDLFYMRLTPAKIRTAALAYIKAVNP